MSPRNRVDVVVVGAGIVGASCAYHLAQLGARVRVVDRASQPATGATAKSAAGVRHQFSHPTNVEMSLHSIQIFKDFKLLYGVDSGYRPVGYLFMPPPEQWAEWKAQVAMQRDLGAVVKTLSPKDLEKRYPGVNTEGIAGGVFGPEDGVVDPHAITMGYLQQAKQLGAEVLLEHEVLSLTRKDERWHVETSQGTLETDFVVNAAGAFAGEVAARASLEVPVKPYRRNVYVTAPLPDYPHPTPLMIDVATGVWVRSEGQRFILGRSNPDEPAGDVQTVDWVWLEPLLTLATTRFPFLEQTALDRKACWAGLYAITPDHTPILGEMPGAPGFVNACGFSGHGVQHSPAAGMLVAEEILEGEMSSFDTDLFRIERFADTDRTVEQNVV
ncbi:MAG: FAD-binding oxidoreductase [Trueperaceae bacterium]|nr:FAD-binding oxidoreductase [Trueperaceae bacterium]